MSKCVDCSECSSLEFLLGFVKDGDHDGTFFAKDAHAGYVKWCKANGFDIASANLFGRLLTKHIYKKRSRSGSEYVVSEEKNLQALLATKFSHERQHNLRFVAARKEPIRETVRVVSVELDDCSVHRLARYVHQETGLLVSQEEPDEEELKFFVRLEKLLSEFTDYDRNERSREALKRA